MLPPTYQHPHYTFRPPGLCCLWGRRAPKVSQAARPHRMLPHAPKCCWLVPKPQDGVAVGNGLPALARSVP